ncbi:MAG: hypothetical protein PHR06_03000 [Candidatus Cloacimonetes bacterium]|nr:hypothetical protein [Candidatus Cloacimonadota bacterium]
MREIENKLPVDPVNLSREISFLSQRDEFNSPYVYVGNRPVNAIDPDVAVMYLIANDLQTEMNDMNDLAGKYAGYLQYSTDQDFPNQILVNLAIDKVEQNTGAALLLDLINSKNDYHYGAGAKLKAFGTPMTGGNVVSEFNGSTAYITLNNKGFEVSVPDYQLSKSGFASPDKGVVVGSRNFITTYPERY